MLGFRNHPLPIAVKFCRYLKHEYLMVTHIYVGWSYVSCLPSKRRPVRHGFKRIESAICAERRQYALDQIFFGLWLTRYVRSLLPSQSGNVLGSEHVYEGALPLPSLTNGLFTVGRGSFEPATSGMRVRYRNH